MDEVLIWDGAEFRNVSRKNAMALVEVDKAQILSDGLIDGLSLKYRHEFGGYKTRQMKADRIPQPEPEPAPATDLLGDQSAPAEAKAKAKAKAKPAVAE